MKSVAIIGTGIAGMACGHFLHSRYELTIYERNNYVGGHTNTILVAEGPRSIPIDTGFMVYNEITYPNLTRLFRELEIETQPTSMSFSVQHVPSGLEFCGSGLSGLFAQKRNLLNWRYWRLLREIARFNEQAPQILDDPRYEHFTLRQYAAEKGYSQEMLDKYLVPMSSAVWSSPANRMLDFPAVTLVRFFKNHGFLGLNTQHPWRTVSGGSRMYREKVVRPFKDRIRAGRAATRVSRKGGKAFVTDSTGETSSFDVVVLASHANESLALLTDPTDLERQLLQTFCYEKNVAKVHTDTSVMPGARSAWSSWNYRAEMDSKGRLAASTIYYMNSLQEVSDKKDYFVSINDPQKIRPDRIIQTITYEHPCFTVEAIAAQKRLGELNSEGPTYFCGSYFKYGFHEDALVSALDVVQKVGVTPWAS